MPKPLTVPRPSPTNWAETAEAIRNLSKPKRISGISKRLEEIEKALKDRSNK